METAENLYGKIWSEREHLIVLHYYFLYKGQAQHADCDYINKLAKLLGRTPHSILYRFQNYASIDPEEKDIKKKGKINISSDGKKLFNEWSQKRESLKDCAEVLIRDDENKSQPTLFNPAPIKLPQAFEKYELLDNIGEGGFGQVFSCLDTTTGKEYAIKIIDQSKRYDPDCLNRFRREIKALKALSHPNIITIYEDNLDKEKNYPGFIMELGKSSLTQYLKEVREQNEDPDERPVLKFNEALNIYRAMLDAIEALHTARTPIIHRDINPNNILKLYNNGWVIADFSLAKFLVPGSASTTFATYTSQAMGTAYYTPPEQYKSLKYTDERTDIYSLGYLIWDLFSSDDPPPRPTNSGLPESLDRVFQKAIERERDDRFQSVQELREKFEDAIKSLRTK